MDNNNITTKNKLKEEKVFKISRFKEYIKKTIPHKHDHYHELIFIKQGEGFHSIEDDKFIVQAPDFYYLQPGQLHFWQFTAVPKGFVILFKASFFDEIKDVSIINAYRQLSKHRRLTLNATNFPSGIMEELLASYDSEHPLSDFTTKQLVGALIGRLLELSSESHTTPTSANPQFDKFNELLLEHIPQLQKVHEYAEQLNTTPQNLNNICKKSCNMSASELINERLLLESKRYILHTNLSFNEIAEKMHFSDSSNFTKFFKRTEQCTPKDFRNKYFQ